MSIRPIGTKNKHILKRINNPLLNPQYGVNTYVQNNLNNKNASQGKETEVNRGLVDVAPTAKVY